MTSNRTNRTTSDFARELLRNIGLITLGSTICALAINGILIPHRFVSGGVTGLALVIHYLVPSLPVSGLYFAINLPLFAMGWKFVGRRFFLFSVAGMVVFSASLQWVSIPIAIHDPVPSALLAGIMSGLGSGIILRSVGSAGGTDILAVTLLNRFSIRLGTTTLAFNAGVLVLAAMSSSLEPVLYTLIYMYVTSHVMNLVATGLSQRKAVLIISSQWNEIAQRVLEQVRRGVTILRGQGAFSGQEEQVLYTVITFRDLARTKRIIRQVDPGAFVVVTDTLEVMGHRIGNQPHW
ncbi:MAG: YitT family protein [Thermodesulfobacteriota bacterium]|nr:YitT family protein [Thermodesulfobacteriota bacterium]